MRNSIQRNLVYDIIQVSCDHPTADMVYLRAKQTMPKISLGTVSVSYTHLTLPTNSRV